MCCLQAPVKEVMHAFINVSAAAADGLIHSTCLTVSLLPVPHLFHRYLPREVDPLVYNMSHEDPGSVSYSEIGGLSEQIRELREVC